MYKHITLASLMIAVCLHILVILWYSVRIGIQMTFKASSPMVMLFYIQSVHHRTMLKHKANMGVYLSKIGAAYYAVT